MRRLRADGYYLLHNHPTGDPKASSEDIQVTKKISREARGMKGHVIINSRKYAVLDREGNSVVIENRNLIAGTDWLLVSSVPHEFVGKQIGIDRPESQDIAAIGQSLKKPGYYLMVSLSGDKVHGLMEVSHSLAADDVKMMSAVRRFGRQTGSVNIYLVGIPFTDQNLSRIQKGIENRLFKDVISEQGESGGEFLKKLPAYTEPKKGYFLGLPQKQIKLPE